jgi:phage-related protein
MSTQEKMSKGKKQFLWTATVSGLVVVCTLFSARPASAQFDSAAILAMLSSVMSTMNSAITPVMKVLNTVNSDMKTFQQTVMYPQTEIQRVQAFATSAGKQMTSMQKLFTTPVNSATLSNTITLESQLLGGNANNIGNIASSYSNVFGTLPSSTALSASTRTTTDASDAVAQDAYKKAVQLDSIANTEQQLASQYLQQLQSTAPGNATLIQAQAAAWNLQASAYTQQAYNEMLRIKASSIAIQSSQIKQAVTSHQTTLQNFGIGSTN